jgi:pimeloyl-ACP methyl ester carboxylesterase
MTEDAIRLLDHLHLKQAHLVGYSMGGVITLKVLATHSDRLLSATLGGHGGIKEDSPVAFYEDLAKSLEQGKGFGLLFDRLTPVGRPKPSPQQALMNQMLTERNDLKALAAVARGFKGLAVSWKALEANQVPTLALIGEWDPLKKGVDELQERMANLKVVVIPEADHMTAFAKPQFVKSLATFLAEHGTRGKDSKK